MGRATYIYLDPSSCSANSIRHRPILSTLTSQEIAARILPMEKIEFKDRQVNGYWQYYVRKKFASGMTAEFSYYPYTAKDRGVELHPAFAIYQKRNKKWPEDRRTTTGRDGLEPAMWALECLTELEEASRRFNNVDWAHIVVSWLDPRREEIYTRLLAKRGYQKTHHDGETVLLKTTRSAY